MYRKLLAVVVAGAAAAIAIVLAGSASAGSAAKQQRISIAIDPTSGSFVLTPLGRGRIASDSGTVGSCCWTRKFFTRDGQAIEVDDPTVTFKGQKGTFTWHERLTFVDSDNGYTIATGVWKVVRGTGAYKHLEGHGREAAVLQAEQFLASKAQGLVDLRGKGSSS